MSRFSTLLPLLLLALNVHAQIGRKELHTDTGTVVLHHFDTGELSTKEWRDKDGHWGWGRSWAYKRDGSVIVEHQTRRFAGHASVRFSYHPNGGISRVEYSEAPDAGIQWYKSTTTFDEAGERTGFTEHGRDNYGPLPRILMEPALPVPKEKPFKQEIVREQRMFVNEVFVVNPTRSAVRVIATPKHPSPALPGGTWTMAPSDTVRIGTYSMGEVFPEWKGHVDLDIHEVVLGNRYNAVARIRTDQVQVSPEHRRHFVVIEGWAAHRETVEKAPTPVVKDTPAQPKKRWRLRFW